MHAQRILDDRRWPNPVVLKITNVKPALKPMRVETGQSSIDAAAHTATLQGNIIDIGDAASLEAFFEYRSIGGGQDVNERTEPWKATPREKRTAAGPFSFVVKDLGPGPYEFRAVVAHPLLDFYGAERRIGGGPRRR